MSEMVERVAAKIAEAGGTEWSSCLRAPGKVMYKMYMNMARASIEEMLDPTEAMIEAGRYCDNGEDMNIGRDAAAEVWRTMAKEALK